MAMHSKDRRTALPRRTTCRPARPPRGLAVASLWILALLLIATAALTTPAPSSAAQAPPAQSRPQADQDAASPTLARAREALEAGRPDDALALVGPVLGRDPDHAAALLVRSTARFMLGDLDAGRSDLERSLALDPKQRQGWLNLAALAVSETRYDDALDAFRRAEALDPRAPDNDVNVGAVLLLRGDLEPASQRFSRYLSGPGATAEGYYLVSSNYALAGYAALAVEHLRQAIDLDERMRRRARTDPNFGGLQENPRFQRLLTTDSHQPPPGAYERDETFPARYEGGRGPLLPAVLDALQMGDRPFDPQVEVTESWALIWGDLRIKVSDTLGDRGRVQLTAAPGAFTPTEWRRLTTDLLQRVQQQALRRTLAVEEQKKREEMQRGGGGVQRPLP